MATKINQQSQDNVVPIGRGRGRPKGSKNKTKGAEQAPAGETRAPSFGTNMPDEGIFLRWVQRLRRQDEEVEKAKLELKRQRGIRKDLRTTARGDGIAMRELDEALEALLADDVDYIAREERRRLYFKWLGLPTGVQGEFNLKQPPSDDEAEAARWARRGDQDGRMGKIREVPEGCPPERIQVYLEHHDKGYEALMRDSPLTREGFRDDGEAPGVDQQGKAHKPKNAKAKGATADPTASEERKIIILHEGHFAAGTWLEDANLKTLLPEHHEAFDAAERVVAVFDTKRRILKEDGYVDDGEEETEVTDPEALEDAAAPSAEDLA